MIEFSDILYGKLALPDWIVPFLRIPEFVRLRGVRLSNVDSFQFKDFGGAARWEHCIAVAALALRCAEKRNLSEREKIHLSLAALFHDVATPPFAHTMENVLEGFDHEIESQRILRAIHSGDTDPAFPVYVSELPQFQKLCATVSKQIGLTIDPDEVAKLVVGDGDLGFLLNGTLDLDNADNVTRASLYLGMQVDRDVPFTIAEWLATQGSVPLDLDRASEGAVVKWLSYRRALYQAFFYSSDEEQGRQAFLQHLCREALAVGIPRAQMIWNTDEGLLTLLESFPCEYSEINKSTLKELVRRYRLLEPPILIASIAIEDDESLRVLSTPAAVNWIERTLSGHSFEPFVSISRRRYSLKDAEGGLFPPIPGAITVFKLGQSTKANQLPDWLRRDAPEHLSPETFRRLLSSALLKRLPAWVNDKPWLAPSLKRKQDVVANLGAVGDWSFRLSRNETLHSYPSTFVHAIPACLISALGLRGELVLDPFGGTGQTAVEAIKGGGRAITADVNSVAVMIARSKITYLSVDDRNTLRNVTAEHILKVVPASAPHFERIEKWHHPDTLEELCRILAFIESHDEPRLVQFMKAAFSAILTGTTGRRGKEHGFFADNTPLPKGQDEPRYEKAIEAFVSKLSRNVEIIERLYALIERSGRSPEEELKRAAAVRVDATHASPGDYGTGLNSVAGIITSPPYLCMSDYSLGQRLSYYWLFPEQLAVDHSFEMGARRRRSQGKLILDRYLADFRSFAVLASQLLRPGGFLATVLGAPIANSFKEANVLEEVDLILKEQRFSLEWCAWRPISWHRNHGYARLRKERIAVYTFNA